MNTPLNLPIDRQIEYYRQLATQADGLASEAMRHDRRDLARYYESRMGQYLEKVRKLERGK